MIQIISTYLIVGVIYTMIMDWLMKNYSPKGEGLKHARIMYNIFIWPLAMYLLHRAYKNKHNGK